jgi:hypothetical protein
MTKFSIDTQFEAFEEFAKQHELLMTLDEEGYEFESAYTQIARDAYQHAWDTVVKLIEVQVIRKTDTGPAHPPVTK